MCFMKRLGTEEIVKRFCEKNGDKYDYSKVEYVNARTKVCVVCREHGEFWVKPGDHLRGVGCPECNKKRLKNGSRRFTKGDFIKKAKELHGDKYDYSKVEYIDCRTKVCIICPEHGEFWQTPVSHLHTGGCQKCSHRYMDTEYFIEKAKSFYGEKYNYEKTEYVNEKTPVCVVCQKHGEFFVNPHDFLSGHGCKKCGEEQRSEKRKYDTEMFICKSKCVHGDKYDYSKVNYIDSKTKVCIVCPEHGEFWQTPAGHLLGYGCPICNESHLEKETNKILIEKKIRFERYKRFNWLGLQSLDFYLSEIKVGIECQGIQHFNEVQHFGGNEGLTECKKRDEKKFEKCKENGVEIFYINYDDDVNKKIEELILEYGL